MRLQILIVVFLLAVLNAYVAISVISRWPLAQAHALAAGLIATLVWVVQLIGPFGDRLLFPKVRKRFGMAWLITSIDWISYLTFGVMSCLLIYCIVADIIEWGLRWIASPTNAVVLDRHFLIALTTLTLVTVALGLWQAIVGPVVRTVEIPLANLPKSFDGFTIVQVSDLHTGETIGRGYTENVVRIVNDLQPDLVALTGDFADGFVDELRDHVAPLSKIEAPHGMFFITGNHEYYWDPDAWTTEFSKLGARVLQNEHVLIHRNGAEVVLAGVTDYSTRHMSPLRASNPSKALAGAPPGRTKILLAHQPDSYRLAHEAGFDLQISGHTHGGQYFPFNLLIPFFQRYYKGLNRHENMWVYVSTGTGYWGPPLRTGVPSEITLIRLRALG
jgi:predicted MPP superfamily phosphohydrolase